MSTIEHVLPVEAHNVLSWQRYLLDSVLAFGGAMLVTWVIYLFQLYPRIPNISIVYLLVVLALASTRGRYPAILASLAAFFSFDYFLVPPLYVFTINRVEEWIALFVFLVTAILTSQLAVALRERAEQASRRERETRILYDLVRVTNREAEPGHQLSAIARAVVDVLSSWGVHDCAILQPDAAGILRVQASAYQPIEQITFSSDEKAIAAWVMAHGRAMGLYADSMLTPSTSARFVQRVVVRSTAAGRTIGRSVRLIPLKLGEKVVGVLRLRILDDPRRLLREERLEEAQAHTDASMSFFWTFLDQVTALIERARLQRENLRIEVLQRTDALRAALLSSERFAERKEVLCMSGARILLVEDDEVLRDLLRRNLEAREHEVRMAADARTALTQLRASTFDLIVLDINLPDQTGWEVLRIAHQHGWLRPQVLSGETLRLPVVVLSAVRVSPQRLGEFHPLAYLPKPFPMEALLRMAAEAAHRRKGGSVYETEVMPDAEKSQLDEEELHA